MVENYFNIIATGPYLDTRVGTESMKRNEERIMKKNYIDI